MKSEKTLLVIWTPITAINRSRMFVFHDHFTIHLTDITERINRYPYIDLSLLFLQLCSYAFWNLWKKLNMQNVAFFSVALRGKSYFFPSTWLRCVMDWNICWRHLPIIVSTTCCNFTWISLVPRHRIHSCFPMLKLKKKYHTWLQRLWKIKMMCWIFRTAVWYFIHDGQKFATP